MNISYKLIFTANVETALPFLLYTHGIQHMSDDTAGSTKIQGNGSSQAGKTTLKNNMACSANVKHAQSLPPGNLHLKCNPRESFA